MGVSVKMNPEHLCVRCGQEMTLTFVIGDRSLYSCDCLECPNYKPVQAL